MRAALLAVPACWVVLGGVAVEAAEAPLVERFSATTRGGIELLGNAIVTCDTSDPACLAALSTGQPSNSWAMSHIDVDADASTFNSSRADLAIPSGVTVLYAGLYWAATTEGSIAPPDVSSRTSVRLETPATSGYVDIAGGLLGDTTVDDDSYGAFAEITTLVQAGGAGTYTVADLQVATGSGSTGPWGGWAIAVVYEDPAAGCRNLTVFDGFENFFFASESLTVTGFQAVATGSVDATLGFFMGDGDRQNTNPDDATDTLTFEGAVLSNAANPSTNFFNNTISRFGSTVGTRDPAPDHTLVVDIDTVDASGILAPGDNSAVVTIASDEGLWWPLMTVELEADCAALSISKANSPSGVVAAGDTIGYTIVVTNSGDAPATDVVVSDPLPTGVSYVAGSAEKTYFVDSLTTGSFTHEFGSATFDTSGLVQSFDSTGSIPAGAVLTSYAFTSDGTSADWLSDLDLVASYPAGNAYSLTGSDFGGNGPGAWSIARGPGSFGGAAEGVYSLTWSDIFDGVFGDDNAISDASFTIEYSVSGGRTSVTDFAGPPPNLVTASDGVRLDPGESLVIRFSVEVDDPLDPAVLEIANVASASSSQLPSPVTAEATNQTEFGVPITLAYFQATETGGTPGSRSVRFDWATSTEVGNVGFYLYSVSGRRIERIGEGLIPSRVVDSVEPQRYFLEAEGIRGQEFFLVDVDVLGNETVHGPFLLNQEDGTDVLDEKQVNWGAIRETRGRETTGRTGGDEISTGGRSARGRESRNRSDDERALTRDDGITVQHASTESPVAEIFVSETGVQRVTYDALWAAGIVLDGVPAGEIAITRNREPVARYVSADPFGPGAFVEFVGDATAALYSKTSVYALRIDRSTAREAAAGSPSVPGSNSPTHYMHTDLVENDHQYTFSARGDDPWFDRSLLSISGPVETEIEVPIDHWRAGAAPVTLTVDVWGGTDFPIAPDHRVVLTLGGTTIGEEVWDGLAIRSIVMEVRDSLLAEGTNTLRLEVPGDTGAQFDLVQFDRYRVEYPRAFVARSDRLHFDAAAEAFRVVGFSSTELVAYRVDPSGAMPSVTRLPVSPESRAGGFAASFAGSGDAATYYVTTAAQTRRPALRRLGAPVDLTGSEAELLIVAHPDFAYALEGFADLRRSEGMSVFVADVQAIYREFGDGAVDPGSIRRYVAYAVRNMQTRAVLLVGGDNYDYHDNLGTGALSFIPTPYVETDRLVRYAPADPLYGDVDGDDVPDVPVGRWPVRTLYELDDVIDRTLAHRGSGRRAVFAADADDRAISYSFAAVSDRLAASLPSEWSIERAYLDDVGLEESRRRLVGEMNSGAALVSYFGHSSPTLWSFDGLFKVSDASFLSNDTPMVVVQWGCWNTYDVSPSYDSVGRSLLVNSGDSLGRGAAAVLGSTTLISSATQERFSQLFMAHAFQPGVTLGEAMIRAKRELVSQQTGPRDVLLGWTLLGDPTLALQAP